MCKATCHVLDVDSTGVGIRQEEDGHVVLTYEGQRGSICDDLFDMRDARVVCRQLHLG